MTGYGVYPMMEEEENCTLIEVTEDEVENSVQHINNLDSLILVKVRTLPIFARQSNCIFVFSASQENVFLNKNRDVDVFVIRARDARGTRAETSINICIIFCIYFLSVENTNTTLQLQHTQNNKKNTRKCLHSFPLMEAAFHRLTFFNIFSIANGEMGFLGFKWGKLSKLFKYLHCDIVHTMTKQYLQYLHIYKDVFVIRHH